jgi:5-methylcytosine-specific restriction protein B
VTSLGDAASEFLEQVELNTDSDETSDAAELVAPVEPTPQVTAEEETTADPRPPLEDLPAATEELARDLLLDLDWLAETMELLNEKKQIVLYGPPGTGKTYLAQAIAEFVAEQTNGEHRLVQFHPSYAYEDFVEGFRPSTAGDDSFRFAKEPGPLRRLVAAAADNPSGAYVLVIDEINRANLAKVFGELYFLLEYREKSIQLQYSPGEDFALPPNVYLIGTMNTADRSIALVDAAMRRRFAWQGLFPGEPPVADMLRRWLDRHGMPGHVADLLDALNAAIADRDAAVGPSYLMNRRVASEAGLDRIWRTQILPLLEERHLGEHPDVAAFVRKRYSLKVLLASLTPTIPAQPDPPDVTDSQADADDGPTGTGEAPPPA